MSGIGEETNSSAGTFRVGYEDLSDLVWWFQAYLAGMISMGRLLNLLRRVEAGRRDTLEPVHCALRELYI